MPTHDIIDNRSREIAPEIKDFLADSIRAHFAVGYSFLPRFRAIADHLELQVAEWEQELNALAYELHGLSEEEMTIVEGRNH